MKNKKKVEENIINALNFLEKYKNLNGFIYNMKIAIALSGDIDVILTNNIKNDEFYSNIIWNYYTDIYESSEFDQIKENHDKIFNIWDKYRQKEINLIDNLKG